MTKTPESLDVRIFDNLPSLAGDRHGYQWRVTLVALHRGGNPSVATKNSMANLVFVQLLVN
ncbi:MULTISPECIES: hypothetical protein [unclassified Synechocystis]|uniref:hypothetical protein n=1 Tax=unclassified Synechocystis TaxID=2640012 RepID=UPI0003F9C3BD|nr:MULTISPECIES: hypothetical protein [unclassified Synechocystis]MCT0253899.1 hypothetical protein [Synechocystis sp. CS-94]